jgi:hypothetical protein
MAAPLARESRLKSLEIRPSGTLQTLEDATVDRVLGLSEPAAAR